MDALIRIKRLVIARRVLFTQKAESEMAADALTSELVYMKGGVDVFYVLISSKRSTDI
jgi:hypothetical protein